MAQSRACPIRTVLVTMNLETWCATLWSYSSDALNDVCTMIMLMVRIAIFILSPATFIMRSIASYGTSGHKADILWRPQCLECARVNEISWIAGGSRWLIECRSNAANGTSPCGEHCGSYCLGLALTIACSCVAISLCLWQGL